MYAAMPQVNISQVSEIGSTELFVNGCANTQSQVIVTECLFKLMITTDDVLSVIDFY